MKIAIIAITYKRPEGLRKLIRELMRKTTQNGCTEEEANTAAQKVEELMEKYTVELADVSTVEADAYGAGRRSTYAKPKGNSGRMIWHEVHHCFGAIAKFCDCKGWSTTSTGEKTYFGSQVDVELAFFLTDTIRFAMETEWDSYRTQHRLGQRGRAAFMISMANRVCSRLMQMKTDREASANQERGLMVLTKDAVVKSKYDQYLKEKGMKMGTRRSSTRTIYNGTRAAGAAAGDRVKLNRPVGGGQKYIG